MPGPLSDLRVIELAGIGPGPHAGMILADLGAEVIQLVRLGTEPDPSDILNRGKSSVAIDLKRPGGPDLVLRLVEKADVLIEGFRPGVTERLGLGPDECLEMNPALVYGRVTGWGQNGPLSQTAGHDIDYIAASGALGSIGPADRPLPPLNLVGDFGGGSMLLVIGVLAGVVEARRSGQGQVVDAAMVDGSALLMAMQHGALSGGWWEDGRARNLFDGSAPFYTTYSTSDGRFVAVGALEPHFYAELVEKLGLADEELPAQMDREAWPVLRERFSEVFGQRTMAEWESEFAGSDACVAGVYSMTEAPRHPHLAHRRTFIEVGGINQPSPAPRFSRTPAAIPGPIPAPGRDTDSVMASLGIETETISRLREEGVLG